MSGHNVNYGAGNVDLGSGARMNDGYVVRGPGLQTATPIDSADSIAVTNFSNSWIRGTITIDTALCIDMIGNYSCAILFNLTLIKKNERAYRFGKERETISYALGKNVMANNLTWLGRMLNKILDFFEKDHSILTVHREGTLN